MGSAGLLKALIPIFNKNATLPYWLELFLYIWSGLYLLFYCLRSIKYPYIFIKDMTKSERTSICGVGSLILCLLASGILRPYSVETAKILIYIGVGI